MPTLRFTPPTSGAIANSGRFDVASNWTPQQAPGPGDTAIITTGTLYIANQTLTAINLFAFSVSDFSATGPLVETQSVTVAANSNIIVEGDSFNNTALTAMFSFENDGRIELSNFAGFGPLENYRYSIVNKGIIVLRDTTLTNDIIENDGTISVSSSFSPNFSTIDFRGTGSLVVGPNTNITFDGLSAGQTLSLTGGTAAHTTIRIVSPSYFQAPIAGFVAGDTISTIFYGTPTSLTYAPTGTHAGLLTVTSASSTVSLALNGDYQAADFTALASPYGNLSITTTRTDQGIDANTPVYRFFDTQNGTHFFTASTTERDTLVNTRPDLSFEGVGLNAADPNGANAAPIYRFFETTSGTHFYTASATERDTVLTTRPDLTFEGIGFDEHLTPQPGDTAVHRFFDTTFGTHFYTASTTEAATITQTRPDLTPEGIGFYAPA